mmetsp:Transcript_65580/g.200856  ORF Transcript_65580/g.200856 Transcript_65580/m.200856 type:complete len:411 (+) Transcript_65580:292-1524(+)
MRPWTRCISIIAQAHVAQLEHEAWPGPSETVGGLEVGGAVLNAWPSTRWRRPNRVALAFAAADLLNGHLGEPSGAGAAAAVRGGSRLLLAVAVLLDGHARVARRRGGARDARRGVVVVVVELFDPARGRRAGRTPLGRRRRRISKMPPRNHQVAIDLRVPGRFSEGQLERLHSFLVTPQLVQGLASAVQRLDVARVELQGPIAILQGCRRLVQFQPHQSAIGPSGRIAGAEVDAPGIIRLGLLPILCVKGLIALFLFAVGQVLPMRLRNACGEVADLHGRGPVGLLLLLAEVVEVPSAGLLCLGLLGVEFLLQLVDIDLVPRGVVIPHRRLVPGVLVVGHPRRAAPRLLGAPLDVGAGDHRLLPADRGGDRCGLLVQNLVLLGLPERRVGLLDGGLPLEDVPGRLVDLVL